MGFNEDLADRISLALKHYKGVEGKLMFGGIAFMLNGRMCCGVIKDDLMARVGPERYPVLLKKPGARPMDFTKRPMKGFLYVDPTAWKKPAVLRSWIKECAEYAISQGPKIQAPGNRPRKKRSP